MKKLLPYLTLITVSCSNSKGTPTGQNNERYLQEDLPFIQKADSICRILDAEDVYEHRKDSSVIDTDGKEYPSQYKGYAKNSADSVSKFVITVFFGGKNSAKSTFYYHAGGVLKGLQEIFADDTVKTAFYFDGDRLIYPHEEGKDDEWQRLAEKINRQSVVWKSFFLPRN